MRLRVSRLLAAAAVATLGTTALLASVLVAPARAQGACQNTGSFDRWLDGFRKEAAAAGISRATIGTALDGVTLDPGIIARDRRQGFFAQSFLDFQTKLATQNRITNGRKRLQMHAAEFARAQTQYGVPPSVIAGFWALESDFGVGMGNLPVLRSLASLAYDCRRGEMFRAELMAALRIIERGDLKPAEMIGSWAGELGQTQFLPTHYFNHAVDADGDGRRNLMKSPADIILSSAAFMKHLGWKAGQPWLEEVRVPSSLPWQEADLAIQHPRSKWSQWGVRRPNGAPVPADTMPASLLIPMGRNGPAFLAYPNFQIYLQWNQSLNYATTAAHLATRIDGAPAMGRGNAPVTPPTPEELKAIQALLARQGHKVGEIDGKLGAATRSAVKAAQLKLGLPADSYPTSELLERLQRAR